MTTNHPAHGPVSLERLHQIREILSKAAAQSDGGNLGYAMADAVKVIDGVLSIPATLPCPVHLEPGLKFGKGVRTQCLLDALRRRTDYYAELEAMTPEQRSGHDAWIADFKAMLGNASRGNMLQADNSPVTPDTWIPVSERMPERDIDVQVYCADKKEQMVAYMERNEGEGWFRFASLPNGGGVYCKPTHWMPLPSAPQQEVNNV
ncbi:DUF551 domain-containing protein [Citrobacter portucalensis]|uniref:DUF551 domain-containing protein n=1 Tax=Citrobacter portucalensis TaxID=1639133 RepID=A0AAW5W8A2_9ENTR|nr:DUF551 domain-containing protein [Citrobacter portucalensis]MCX9004668.1 DUF551 domain-containing protein [Citrobacter portucalensis]